MFAIVLEWLIMLLLVIIIFSQILLPFVQGTQIFTIFRKENKLRDEMSEVKQKIKESELTKEIETLKKEKGV